VAAQLIGAREQRWGLAVDAQRAHDVGSRSTVPVAVQVEALGCLLKRRPVRRRSHAGLLLLVGLAHVATASLVILVLGPAVALVVGTLVVGTLAAVALVVGTLVALALGLVRLGLGVVLLVELGLVLGLAVLLVEVGVVLGLVVILVLVEAALVVEPTSIGESVAGPLGRLSDHVGQPGQLAERGQRADLAQLRSLRARDPRRGDQRRSRGDRLHAAMATPMGFRPMVVVRSQRRLDSRREDPIYFDPHLPIPFRDCSGARAALLAARARPVAAAAAVRRGA